MYAGLASAAAGGDRPLFSALQRAINFAVSSADLALLSSEDGHQQACSVPQEEGNAQKRESTQSLSFKEWYVGAFLDGFEEDLDVIRRASSEAGEKEPPVDLLIEGIKAGADLFGSVEQSLRLMWEERKAIHVGDSPMEDDEEKRPIEAKAEEGKQGKKTKKKRRDKTE